MATIEEGVPAPELQLDSTDGGALSLRDLRGSWVVLYFYPRDATPGCTAEAIDFRDARNALAARGAVVVGISKDSVASHERFRDKHGLGFPLLSDPTGKVIERYGAWGEKNMYGKKSMGIVRTTLLIDPEGVVRRVWPKVRVKGHVEEVLEALDALRT